RALALAVHFGVVNRHLALPVYLLIAFNEGPRVSALAFAQFAKLLETFVALAGVLLEPRALLGRTSVVIGVGAVVLLDGRFDFGPLHLAEVRGIHCFVGGNSIGSRNKGRPRMSTSYSSAAGCSPS